MNTNKPDDDTGTWPPEPQGGERLPEGSPLPQQLTPWELLDAAIGFISGVVVYIALILVVFNPITYNLLKPPGRNGQVVAAWSFATLSHFGLYFFLRRYPVLSPVFLFAGILLALPTLLIIVLGWYL